VLFNFPMHLVME